MPDIRKDIERIINSDIIDSSELSRIVNALRDEARYDLIDSLTQRLLRRHTDDDILLLRAWYLINIEGSYQKADSILRTIGESDNVMYALLRATIVLRTSFDAERADDILQEFIDTHDDVTSEMATEAARLFVNDGFTDMAEKWIMRYNGRKDSNYLMIYGSILVAEEEYGKAAEVFRKITEDEPHSTEAWLSLSDVLIDMKDYRAASEAARKALDTDPGSRKAEENIQMCSLCINRHNKRLITNQ